MKFSKTKTIQAVTFISWQPYCSRSDNIAREFGGQSYKVYYDSFGSRYSTILFKYSLQFFKTLFLLFRDKPDVVFVMSPPVFAIIPVYIYCKIFKKKFIIDAHTGAFLNPIWEKVMFIQKFFCTQAELTIVTNNDLLAIIKTWSARGIIVPDVKVKYENTVKIINKKGIYVTLVSSFATDEPISEFIEAAGHFKDIKFFITGKYNNRLMHLGEFDYSNICFTGFLPNSKYYGLLSSSDLIASLTTKDKTMQRGAYEAIYFDKPVLTSNWPILRENFNNAAIFVDPTVESIRSGLKTAFERLPILTNNAKKLKEKKESIWENNKDILIRTILNK